MMKLPRMRDWKWLAIGILLGGALAFASGCGTVSGILQDIQGAVDGINEAHNNEGGE